MSEELWYVKLADGDVHRVTLDQLDGAFQAGQIDERTMVLGADATEWMSLGDLLGGGDESADGGEAAQAAAPAAAPSSMYDHLANEEPIQVVRSLTQTQAMPAVQLPPAYAQAQAQASAQTHLAAPRAPAYTQPGGYGYAPAAAPSYAPAPATPYGYAPPNTVASSLRPMSVDLGDDLDVDYPKRSKKPFAVAVFAIAAMAAGVGFVATRAHGSGDDIASVAAAAAMAAPHDTTPAAPPPPAAAPLPSPAVAPPSAPVANAAPADGSPLNPQFTTRFNEDKKQTLLATDKTREPKTKAHHANAGVSHASSPKAKSTLFTTGGNKFDPLNSSI